MPLIFISSESKRWRRQLAEDLAKKLGYECFCREDLVESATAAGIPVGKLEMAMVKSPAMSERLARQKERYLAFITSHLCERARSHNFVYHGRAGHLLLPGIAHVMKARLVVDQESRILEAMQDLKLSSEKAREYVKNVDEDIERWVRYFYGVRRDEPGQYDIVINLENMSLPNASSLLCYMADLPDFRPTPASLKAMENRSLEARARAKLALDARTMSADLKVRAADGVATITHMPRQPNIAEIIPQVLEGLEGCKEVMCTMASTNILWVQENFNPKGEAFGQLNQLAKRWDAAIELIRFSVPPEMENMLKGSPAPAEQAGAANGIPVSGGDAWNRAENGGIEDDEEASANDDQGGVSATIEELINEGRSGGAHTIEGNFHDLLSAIRRDVSYSLIVLGDLFSSKSHETQTRMRRELSGYLNDRLSIPVITTDELQKKYLLGMKQYVKVLGYSAVVAALYLLVFHFQDPILSFLGGAEKPLLTKVVRSAIIFLFVPAVAYLYGTVASIVLKALKFE
jgi:cytidylate kinase